MKRGRNIPVGSIITPTGNIVSVGNLYNSSMPNLNNRSTKVGKMSAPFYDLTGKKFFCFSDEEGGAPFKFDGDGTPKGPSDEVRGMLDSTFTFDDGLITELKAGNALGFMGDLIDNQDHSIRAMESMVKLKGSNPLSVILIAGNRDFNKIRYGVELFFTVDGDLPWAGTRSFTELYDKLSSGDCKFRETSVPPYLQGAVAPWNANLGKADGKIKPAFEGHNFKMRLETIMGPTMATGTPGVITGPGAIAKELEAMIPEMAGKLTGMDEAAAKFICAMQMAMSLEWTSLPDFLKRFNGLYIQYLEKAHIGALFQIGDKMGYLSHAGLPYGESGENLSRGLTAPLGLPYTNGDLKQISLMEMIGKNEAEKNQLLTAVKKLINSSYSNETDYLIDKFVHLTAGTHKFDYTSAANEYQPYKFSPIVNYARPINAIGNIKVKLQGGAAPPSWIAKNKGSANKSRLQFNSSKSLDYNIYGHQPQGFLPTAYRRENTLHVCLDISKLESGGTNNYSFTFLVIDGTDEKFVGRIKFPVTPSTKYNSAPGMENVVQYYIEPITGAESRIRKIAGTNISIQYTAKPPPIFEERAVIGTVTGGRRRKSKKTQRKVHRKSKKTQRKVHRKSKKTQRKVHRKSKKTHRKAKKVHRKSKKTHRKH
jgi:hypothetical protein